ncbi:hypothetical protein [Marinobacter sp. JSM 1782161]|uniref:hypothetical protein n=1 Tax=Marinobacter sp. JSM 1782161 TaxID=2685906 RepID=UPI00140267A5|nr:hypothetical protein [Marinobacter sp. JSM 1782161]
MSAVKDRLPLSFHMTFQPERHYLSALLRFAQVSSGASSIDAISQQTGIPTGKSSGKVRPLLQYARGMGLITTVNKAGEGVQVELTTLGQTVVAEDSHLIEETTQWALHLLLCRARGGAEAWHTVFVEVATALGQDLDDAQFEAYLDNKYGSSRDVLGPLVRTYADPAALGKAAAIQKEEGRIRFRKMPLQPAYFDTLGALLLLVWDDVCPDQSQVALRELEAESGLMAATGWNTEEQSDFLASAESAGLLRVDRQTGAPILTRLMITNDALEVMYDRLI